SSASRPSPIRAAWWACTTCAIGTRRRADARAPMKARSAAGRRGWRGGKPLQGTANVKVKSPVAVVEQPGAELKQDAQVGADMQAAGRASHENRPGFEMAPPTVAEQ